MPLFCGTKKFLAHKTKESKEKLIEQFVAAMEAVPVAEGTKRFYQRKGQQLRGDDPNVLVVLQREIGAVSVAVQLPVDASSPSGETVDQLIHPSCICSVDATTCLILAARDRKTGKTVLTHIDDGGSQAEGALRLLLVLVGATGPVRKVQEVAAGSETPIEKAQLDAYLVGCTKWPSSSADTLSSVLKLLSSCEDADFHVLPHACSVWSQNVVESNGTTKIVHRGLWIDANSGQCAAVEAHPDRAYPAGRLRSLRFMSSDPQISPIVLLPGESMLAKKLPRPKVEVLDDDDNLVSAEEAALTPDPQSMLVVRPFTWSLRRELVQQPVSYFVNFSTSPDFEPQDFASSLKSSIVYGCVTKPIDVFPNNKSPVLFQATKDGKSGTKSWVQIRLT